MDVCRVTAARTHRAIPLPFFRLGGIEDDKPPLLTNRGDEQSNQMNQGRMAVVNPNPGWLT